MKNIQYAIYLHLLSAAAAFFSNSYFRERDLFFANSPTAGMAVLDSDFVFEVTTAGPSHFEFFFEPVKSI